MRSNPLYVFDIMVKYKEVNPLYIDMLIDHAPRSDATSLEVTCAL
jgi:hypothetical protein